MVKPLFSIRLRMVVFLSAGIPTTQNGESVGWQSLSKAACLPVIRKWSPQIGLKRSHDQLRDFYGIAPCMLMSGPLPKF